MSDIDTPQENFENQMQALAAEAEKKKQEPSRSEPAKSSDWFIRIAQLFKPMAVGIESLTRATSDHSQTLQKLGQTITDHSARFAAVDTLREEVAQLNETQASNQRLFDAMHEEMRGYKDQFLFDTMQKPFIKDILVVLDDLQVILAQTKKQQAAIEEDHGNTEDVLNIVNNLENSIHHILEVLNRLDVERMEPAGSVLDKRLHRVVGFEDSPEEEDGQIAKSVRPGFLWKDRVIRPEEVILKRTRP